MKAAHQFAMTAVLFAALASLNASAQQASAKPAPEAAWKGTMSLIIQPDMDCNTPKECEERNKDPWKKLTDEGTITIYVGKPGKVLFEKLDQKYYRAGSPDLGKKSPEQTTLDDCPSKRGPIYRCYATPKTNKSETDWIRDGQGNLVFEYFCDMRVNLKTGEIWKK